MSRSVLPEKIIRTRNSDGSKSNSEIYSLDNWLNLNVSSILLIPLILIFIIFIPAISAFMLLSFCLKIDRKEKPIGLCIFGGLFSLYLLLDIHKGWILSTIIDFFYNKTEMPHVIYLNGATFITSFFVLLYSDSIFEKSGKSKFISFLYIAAITLFFYLLSSYKLNNII